MGGSAAITTCAAGELQDALGPPYAPGTLSSYQVQDKHQRVILELVERIMKGKDYNIFTNHSVCIYRFCGDNLNALGFPNTNQPIISCECPFELSHITGITALSGVGANSADSPVGFQLSYSQIAGSC